LETTVKSVADAVSLRSSDSRCENLAQLVVAINRILEDQSDSSTPGFGKFVLVFDGIDRQRDAPPTLLPALARLGELVGI
jgi:origin recognition complex subunit 5